jgi:hypothetical protein
VDVVTSFSTYSGTVAAVCLMGLSLLVCFGCLNKMGVQYMKKHHTLLHRKSFEDFKCEQTRACVTPFNSLHNCKTFKKFKLAIDQSHMLSQKFMKYLAQKEIEKDRSFLKIN